MADGGTFTLLDLGGTKWGPIIDFEISHCIRIMWIVVKMYALGECLPCKDSTTHHFWLL